MRPLWAFSFSSVKFGVLNSWRKPAVAPVVASMALLAAARVLAARNMALLSEPAAVPKRSRSYRHGGFYPKPHQDSQPDAPLHEKWRLPSQKSKWWDNFLENPATYDTSSYWGKRFEELFIVPRLVFDELLDELRQAKGFKDEKLPEGSQRWVSFKEKAFGAAGRGTATQSLPIKLLAALMRLRGTKFAVIQEMADISAICLERFYYAWCAWYVKVRYPVDVFAPSDPEDIRKTMDKYHAVGMPGAICGIDATHLHWAKCASNQKHLCKGKEGFPTVMFNVQGDDQHAPRCGRRLVPRKTPLL